jgi:hypothetical protein
MPIEVIADFRLPIADLCLSASSSPNKIGNWESETGNHFSWQSSVTGVA